MVKKVTPVSEGYRVQDERGGVVVSWNTTIARGRDDAPCVNVATAGRRRLHRTPVLFVALYAG